MPHEVPSRVQITAPQSQRPEACRPRNSDGSMRSLDPEPDAADHSAQIFRVEMMF
jgi:hypothetical protein